MEGADTEPLIKRKDFRVLSQPRPEPVVVQCCCLQSRKLGRVPVVRTLFKKKDPSQKVGILRCGIFLEFCDTAVRHCMTIGITIYYHVYYQGTFSSSFGVLLSMLGSVVGTGNIWRFPRIVANNAIEGGISALEIAI